MKGGVCDGGRVAKESTRLLLLRTSTSCELADEFRVSYWCGAQPVGESRASSSCGKSDTHTEDSLPL